MKILNLQDMESTRQQKLSRLLQKDLGSIFLYESASWSEGALITVTKVNITRDLSLAHVYLSIFKAEDKDAVFKKIEASYKEIRRQLGEKIRHQVKKIPEMKFHIDDSLDYIENIENLLNE